MMLADKEQMRAEAKVSLVKLQQLELDYHVDNCLSIGLQSCIIAGLAYYGTMEIDDSSLKGYYIRLAYYTVTYISMCLCLVAAFITTFSAISGPGYALRGPDGSINDAVVGVSRDVNTAYTFFLIGLFLLFPSLLLFLFAVHSTLVALASSVLMVAMMVSMQRPRARPPTLCAANDCSHRPQTAIHSSLCAPRGAHSPCCRRSPPAYRSRPHTAGSDGTGVAAHAQGLPPAEGPSGASAL